MNRFRWKWLGTAAAIVMVVTGLIGYRATAGVAPKRPQPPPQTPKYVVLAWNNLGMHCYDPDFSNLGILPPYNTLVAQVIKVGDASKTPPVKPEIFTTGVTVEYSFPDNTYSVNGPGVPPGRPDKSNFWEYAQTLFNLPEPLTPNIGLTDKGLSGTMDLAKDGDYFIAEGIPLTDIRDQDAVTMKPYPFQKALITVKDVNNPEVILTQLTVVAPVSTELSCAMCHADEMDATTMYPITPTGKVETNILAIHDYLNSDNYAKFLANYPDLLAKTPLSNNQPVLCAWCHADAALGADAVGDVKSLSNAMHGHHNPTNAPDITPDTQGCYFCHPGPETRCLRDTMSQNFAADCTNCHGDITIVAQNQNPWLNEPQCSNDGCHGPAYAPNQPAAQPLYRLSTGHGGIFCEGCHDSTHAVAPSREYNDTIKFIELQGHAGTLSDCAVCHKTKPAQMFKHPK